MPLPTPTSTKDIEALRLKAAKLAEESAALTLAYDRITWFRFFLVFFPVPMVVLLLRFEMEGWHYIIAGGAYIVFSLILYTIDGRAAARCDEAVRAAGRARQAYELASYAAEHAR